MNTGSPSHCGWAAGAPSCGELWEEVWNVFCSLSVWGSSVVGGCRAAGRGSSHVPVCMGIGVSSSQRAADRVVCRVACVEMVPTKELKVGADSVSAGSQGMPLREGDFGTHG